MANAIRKRIALAAAVAVSAGLLSAVPAQATGAAATSAEPFIVTAAEYVADSAGTAITGRNTGASVLTDATVAVSHPAGASNFVQITADTNTASTAAAVRIDVTGSTIVSAGNTTLGTAGVINTARTSVTYETNTIQGAAIRFATTAAGSFTVKVTSVVVSNGIATDTALQTFNVTVNAAAVAGVVSAAKSVVRMDTDQASNFSGASDAATGWQSTDSTIVASATTAAATEVAVIGVLLNDANGVAVTGKDLTVTISGPGLLSIDTTSVGGGLSSLSGTGRFLTKTMSNTAARNYAYVGVYADGNAGVATITLSVGTTELAKKTVTFFGKTTKLVATVDEPHIVAANTDSDATVTVVATDANGVPVANEQVSVTSGTTSVIAASGITNPAVTGADGKTTFVVNGAASGTSVLTIKSADTLVSTTIALTVTDGEIASLVLTSNKATYAAGEKITLTLTAKDKNGVLMGKKQFASLFTTGGITASSAVVGALFGETVTISAGVATVDVFAPLAAGTLTFSGKTGTAGLATAEQGITKSLSVTISGSADIAQIKADLAALQKSTSDLIAALSAQVSYLRKQLNQLLRRR